MSDLVRGIYPVSNPAQALLGQQRNVVNPSIPARGNHEFFGLGNPSDGALASTGVLAFAAVPVEPGTVISKVSIFVGATAASTPTHSFAALYGYHASAPPLIVQSTDGTTTAVPASARFDFTLSTATQITTTHAPYGFIYAGVMFTGTAIPTAMSFASPTGVQYAYFTNSPLGLGGTSGSSLTTTAASTLTYAAKAVTPWIVLT
jgi:hypothetical protein